MEPPEHHLTAPTPGSTARPAAPARIGRFRVTATLGEGGMGVVYAAIDLTLERRVAIKVIRRELTDDVRARERFCREARVVADVADPHICRVHDIGDDDGRLFIVMELLEGEPLAVRLRRGALPFADAVTILLEILSALDTLHGRGVVHRDLKPSNVFLTPGGAKLLDFGLARETPDAAGATRADLTGSGTVLGTPRYMAPEQLLGQPVDARTDLFAAGSILYELLAGQAPFEADSLVGAMTRVLNPELPSLGGSPGIEAADRIIQRALAYAPHARYPSAAAMRDDVRSLLVYCAREAQASVVERRAPARSIAVLPFLGIGSQPDDDDFADGMTEDVIAQLSKIRALKVIARASVMGFKEREQTPKEIGARLGVRTLLDGSIRRAGTRVRIVAQLVDAATEAHLWSETYDRDLTDIFSIQADVARQIARALEAELTSGERARLGRKPTDDLAAYQLYLKGRHCFLRYTVEGVRQALGFFEQAVAGDPGFALGHAWIALTHTVAGMGYRGGAVRPAEAYRLARDAAERALAFDPDLGEAHGALACVRLVMDFDWNGSEREFQIALELNPNSDFMWSAYGLLLSAVERYDEAIAAYRRARTLDPLAAVHSSSLASTLLRAGRVGEALEEARRLTELEPEFPLARSNLGWALLKEGGTDEGLVELERAVSLAPGNTMLLGQLGHAYGLAGRAAQARDVLARMRDVAGSQYLSPYHLAYIYAGLGEADLAIDCLERAHDERAGGMYGVKGSFLFTGLSSHPRFAALLQRMHLDQGVSVPPEPPPRQ